MPTRGIVYNAWGEKSLAEARRSAASAKKYGYQTVLLTDEEVSWPEFDVVHYTMIDRQRVHLNKASNIYRLAPFDLTCFLDSDTIVCDELCFGFKMAELHGMALTIAPFYDLASVPGWQDHQDWIQYNTGVIFFDHKYSECVFNRWKELCEEHVGGETNDQPHLSRAIFEMEFNPFVLPASWNFRDKWQYWHGRIKVWHSRRKLPKSIVAPRPMRGSRE